MINESAVKRKDIPDNEFGLPKLRKFRLDDRQHVSLAITYFGSVKDKKNQKILADNIIDAMKKYDMHPKVSTTNSFYKYLPDEYKSEPVRINESSGLIKSAEQSFQSSKDISSYYIHDKKVFIPVYVLLTKNYSVLGNAIRKVTKEPYNHSSITTDQTMNKLYSFGGNGEDMGFIIESIYAGRFKELADNGSEYALYVTFIEQSKYTRMEQFLNQMVAEMDKWQYNTIGLIRYMFKVPSPENDKMFCSQFVSRLLKEADDSLVTNDPSLVSPVGIITNKFYPVSSGFLKDYDAEHTKRVVKKLRKQRNLHQFLTENSVEINNILYRNVADEDLAKILANSEGFTKFYPSQYYPEGYIWATSLGGMSDYFDKYIEDNIGTPSISADQYQALLDDIEMSYDVNVNHFKAAYTDPGHLVFCRGLHSRYSSIMQDLSSGNITDAMFEFLDEWEIRVRHLYSFLKDTKTTEDINSIKQGLHDLMWWHGDDPFDENVVKKNIYKIAIDSNRIKPINEDSIVATNRLRAKLIDIISKETDEINFLIPATFQYPIIDFESLLLAADEYKSVDDEYKGEFIKNFIQCMNKYWLYKSQLIPSNYDIAKHLPEYMVAEMPGGKVAPLQAVNEAYSGRMQCCDTRFGFVASADLEPPHLFGTYYSVDSDGRSYKGMWIPFEGDVGHEKESANCKLVKTVSDCGEGLSEIAFRIVSTVPIKNDNYLILEKESKEIPEIKVKLEEEKANIANWFGNLNEGIKGKVYNFSLDDDGNILIEKKENSDFPTHYRNSLKILNTYKKTLEKGQMVEGVKHELCKLFYMARLIEIYYINPRDKLSKEKKLKQKEMIDTRALILNTFDHYMGIVLNLEPHFNFSEYFANSKYGDNIKISKGEVRATIDLVGYMTKFL